MRWYVRPVDVALVGALAAAAAVTWASGSILRQAAAVVLAAVAAGVAWLSSGPGVWVRRLHLDTAAPPGPGGRQGRRRGARLPTPCPDAWYAVALSPEVPPGTTRAVTVANLNLVVWRPAAAPGATTLPAPIVMDAYCTHLGAHLGMGGGRVEGDCIRCPFHGWKFDVAGKLKEVPGADTCPPGADMKTWPTMERNQVISVWVSSQVHKRAPPTPEEVARLDALVARAAGGGG